MATIIFSERKFPPMNRPSSAAPGRLPYCLTHGTLPGLGMARVQQADAVGWTTTEVGKVIATSDDGDRE